MNIQQSLETLLPKVLVEELFLYYHPDMKAQRKRQRKVNLSFRRLRKYQRYQVAQVESYVGWDDVDRNEILHPSVTRMLTNLSEYKANKIWIRTFLKSDH